MTDEHTAAAARLRATLVDHGVFSRLGAGFWEAFLRGVVRAPDGLAFVALGPSDDLAGYAVITPDIHRLHEQVLKGRRLSMAMACAAGLARRPYLIPAVLRAAFRPQTSHPNLLRPQWVTVMVSSAYRRRGVAAMLFQLISAALHERGVEEFHSPVELDNDASNALQEKLGGTLDFVAPMDGVGHNIWRFHTAPLPPPPPGHVLCAEPGMPSPEAAR
ncbi:MAG: GNAT family N-acetyltransferase [Acidobacteriota bacterium]|nr:MAG: GNAT family N-acetyltransferase [Acidobacteriota bacterium]